MLNAQDKEAVLAKVEQMFQEGKIVEAKVQLEGLLETDSTCIECHHGLAMLYSDKDNPESYRNIALSILLEQTMLSELEVNRVTQFSLGVKSSNFQLGKMKNSKKGKVSTSELETALYLINKAIKMHENAPDYYCIRGDIKKMLGMQDYCLDYHTSIRLGNVALEEFVKEVCK